MKKMIFFSFLFICILPGHYCALEASPCTSDRFNPPKEIVVSEVIRGEHVTYIDRTKVHVTFSVYDNRKFTGRVSFNHSGTCENVRVRWLLYGETALGWQTSRNYSREHFENKNFTFDEYLSPLDYDVIMNGGGAYRIYVDEI